jgi:hypothetical protein
MIEIIFYIIAALIAILYILVLVLFTRINILSSKILEIMKGTRINRNELKETRVILEKITLLINNLADTLEKINKSNNGDR